MEPGERGAAAQAAAPALHATSPSTVRGRAAASAALAKAIVGAGVVAVPHAFLSLGAPLGAAALLGVALLVAYTKCVLVDALAAHPGAASYRTLAQATCRSAAVTLATQASIVLFCWGFVVVDLVVVADVVRGSPPESCNGLLCLAFGVASGPLVNRSVVLLAVAGGVAAPLLLVRSMARLTPLNYLGMASALLLSGVAAVLGASALWQGVAHPLPLLPQPGPAGSTGDLGPRLAAAAGTLAVLLSSFVAHQSLLPVAPLLKPAPTRSALRSVVAAAVGGALLLYASLSLGTALAFGPGVAPDVLSNFSPAGMAPLLGGRGPVTAVSAVVLLGYAVSVTASLVLFVHPLRTAAAELIWGRDPGAAAAKERRHHYALTYGLLAAATATAVCVPDVWAALAAIGDCAASVEAFVVPGLIALALQRRAAGAGAGRKSGPIPSSGGAGEASAALSQPLLMPAAFADSVAGVEEGAAGGSGSGPAWGESAAEARPPSGGNAALLPRMASLGRAAMAWFTISLGLALFANGIFQFV